MTHLAAIFDWDGVVVDSSRLHVLSWEQLAREERRELPPVHQLGSLGLKTQAVITDLLGWTRDDAQVTRITLRKEEIFREMARAGRLQPQPGVLGFLRGLNERGIPCAVGSSAPRLNIEAGLDALGAHGLFRAMVSGDDVARGKPAPDIFLRAAERIGADAARCVVFEDAPAGVAAARAAGMRVVGVLTTHEAGRLAGAHRYVPDFAALTAGDLVGWFDGTS